MNLGSGEVVRQKPGRISGLGQGIGAVKAIQSAGAYIDTLVEEYEAAKARLL